MRCLRDRGAEWIATPEERGRDAAPRLQFRVAGNSARQPRDRFARAESEDRRGSTRSGYRSSRREKESPRSRSGRGPAEFVSCSAVQIASGIQVCRGAHRFVHATTGARPVAEPRSTTSARPRVEVASRASAGPLDQSEERLGRKLMAVQRVRQRRSGLGLTLQRRARILPIMSALDAHGRRARRVGQVVGVSRRRRAGAPAPGGPQNRSYREFS